MPLTHSPNKASPCYRAFSEVPVRRARKKIRRSIQSRLRCHSATHVATSRRAPRDRLSRTGLRGQRGPTTASRIERELDRKSTRLNSSHANISYAVFCLKKKKKTKKMQH